MEAQVEFDDISFGHIALSRSFVSRDALKEAVEIQNRLRSMGIQPKRLGEILIEKRYMTPDQLEAVLTSQKTAQSRQRIAGYHILEKLGQGGMGVVYKAKQTSMERIVALKILPRRLAKDEEFIKRFIKEARASARLNHENIISGIDVGESGGLYYFAMEYADGETVDKIVSRDGALPEEQAINIIIQIARALVHAQKNNLVHRDIKPQNIILTRKGIAKLCDLGLAKNVAADAGEGTRTNVSVGTPHYISPEQARGDPDVDIRSDIYSLGATFYHLVVGEVPFTGTSPMVVMTKHLTEPPMSPKSRSPHISKITSNIILKMMAKNPDNRFQDPMEVIDILSGKTNKPGISPRKRRPSGRLPLQGARRPPSSRLQRVQETPRRSAGQGISTRNRSKSPSRRGRSPSATWNRGSSKQRDRRGSRGRKPYGGSRGRSKYDDPDRGEYRAGRMRAIQSAGNNEMAFLIIGVVVIVVLILVVILSSGGPSGFEESIREGEREKTQDNYLVRAYNAYEDAFAYEKEFPYEVPEVLVLYRTIISNYPGTPAAKSAQKRIDICKEKRY